MGVKGRILLNLISFAGCFNLCKCLKEKTTYLLCTAMGCLGVSALIHLVKEACSGDTTSGAFWGMGNGFGCGVGWDPGFGPEVIGYVGAGCGPEIARSSGLLNLRNGSASGWSNIIGPYISGIQQKALGRVSISKLGDLFNLSEMPRVLDHLQEFGADLLHPPEEVAIVLAHTLSKKIYKEINSAHNKTKDSELKLQYNSCAEDAIRDIEQSKKRFKNNDDNK
ncbi:hypothetical protein RHSIM_Rhsim11G0026500 [Rhododendron simsii]|uniref:Uncharacterized protein n=1 Tax=Rhododendron simsii TaxID=118357 RepID=A0A834G6A3_RHOSS|nr:hypothetical protein RHSIM_Rhsim11G0026500 [Rhododendron simsii]